MSTVFISYTRKNEVVVRTLADDIGGLGHTVWFDHDLSGGQAWWDQILANVRACDVFIFVLSPEALNSTACDREYHYADDLGKLILPILVAEGVSTNLLPPALAKIQYVDYRKQDRRAILALFKTLSSLPPPEPLPDPLPAPPEVPVSYLGSLTEQVKTTSALSFQEQSSLVIDLKRSLRDPETADDARTLLESLRKRHDCYAKIADEIDELLVSTATTTTPPPPAPEPTTTTTKGARTTTTTTKAAPTGSVHKPTNQERMKGAGILAGAGVIVGMIPLIPFGYFGIIPPLCLGTGGVIAGAISGMDRSVIVAAVTGIIVAQAAAYAMMDDVGLLVLLVVWLLAPPLGALFGVFIKKQIGSK